MLKIAVFGASVSAQSRNHQTGEVTGYSEALREYHAQELGDTVIERFTYPGNRLSDGGLLRLSDVLQAKPDICLFEPLIEDASRGARVSDDEICFVYKSLLEAGILPVTLMQPIPQQRKPEANPAFRRYNAFCNKHNLPVIKVDLTDIGTLEGRFQGIHTTNEGARIYASQIVAGLQALEQPEPHLAAVQDVPPFVDIPVSILPLDMPVLPEFRFQLRPKSDIGTRARLIQLQEIGPFSPVLDVVVQPLGQPSEGLGAQAEAVRQSISIWDPYCHYKRRSFVTIATVALRGDTPLSVHVKISDADPDYASCRREVASWPAAGSRELLPIGQAFLIADCPIEVCPGMEGGV